MSVPVIRDTTYLLWPVHLWCLKEVLEIWTETNFNEDIPTVDFRISFCNIVLGIETDDVLTRDRLTSSVWQVAPNVALERVSSRLGGLQEVETLCRLYFDGLGCQEIRGAER